MHKVSECCQGEKCRICYKPATHKVAEEIQVIPPEIIYEGNIKHRIFPAARHPLTAYLCCDHFVMIFGEDIDE